MPEIPPSYRAVIVDHQIQLARLIRSAGVAPVKALYADMLREIEQRLGATTAGTFDHQRLVGMVAQVRIGMARLARGVAGAMEDGADQVGIHAARTMLLDAAALEHRFTGAVMPIPLLQSARLHGLVAGTTESVMRVHESSMARYGVKLVRRFEGELGNSLALGETPVQAIDRIQRAGALEWHGAERLVRTELSYAAGAAARDAADEQADELDGDMWSRWTEHVSDEGTPLDDRVGVDSEAMHGQVAHPGGMFTQPPMSPQGEAVGDSLVGKQWACPPNRPNDRSVLVPWRASWDVPGWRWEGKRIPVTDDHVEKMNERWMRKRRTPDAEPERLQVEPTIGERSPFVQVPDEVVDQAPPTQIYGPGFFSPVPKIPTHAEITALRQFIGAPPMQVIPAAEIAKKGWFEADGEISPEQVAAELRSMREGIMAEIDASVAPSGSVTVDKGREGLHAAVHAKTPVAVSWSTGPEPSESHVGYRVGEGRIAVHADVPAQARHEPAEDAGFRIGVGRISNEEAEPVAPTRAVPVYRHVIREPVLPADEPVLHVPAPIPEPPLQPKGTTEYWRHGDENRRKQHEVVQLAKPKTVWLVGKPETEYERDLRLTKQRQEKSQEEFRRWEANRPITVPRGYDVVEDFPGIKTYVSQRTGKRYTEMDVRRGTLDPAGTAPLGAPPKASVVRPGLATRIGRGLRAFGRRIIGR